jgi:thiol-disulfide isomerase/thioredoxin
MGPAIAVATAWERRGSLPMVPPEIIFFGIMKTLLGIGFSLLVSCGALVAADTKKSAASTPSHNLSEFKLGEIITGPAVSLADATGKAVVIEAWGVHCGPCLASLPHIESMAKRNKGKMLVFGAHSQTATDEEVKQVVKKNQLSYTITKGVNGPVRFSGIPHAFVFDTTGALVFSGHPANKEFENAVRKATRGAAGSSDSRPVSGLDALKALQAK